MSIFFYPKIQKQIELNESDPIEIKKFLNNQEVNELLDYRKNASEIMVDREESTKIPFEWKDDKILRNLKNKIKEIVGDFYVKDFKPHFITTRFPLRLHADTGKDPGDLIFKNIVIPLEINYENEASKKNTSHTVIFKNKWYQQSALFTTKTDNNYDFILKDKNGTFVDIIDIFDFKKEVDKVDDELITYKQNKFEVNDKFKEYINTLSKTKRYNQRTDAHIVSQKDMDKKIYEKYMTHQPYEDCRGLELDRAMGWEVGSLLYWDRVRIHSSDNFIKNGIVSKTCIALFTSK